MKALFHEAIPIIEKLEQAGYEAVFVGGAVRDSLLSRPIGDIDIATNAKPSVIQDLFDKTIPVGIEHGTVLVLYNNQSYEITTYRVDGDYHDYRHPEEVVFVSDIQEDLARRDFTINAIAMTKSGELIDPFNGQEDLHRKIIQTVNNPNERFQEDPLRMMRALRFVSQLGFCLEEKTQEAIVRNGPLLQKIATERNAVEMEKLVLGNSIAQAFEIILHTKIFHHLPVFQQERKLLYKAKEYIQTPFLSMAEWIAFLHELAPTCTLEQWCKSWKLSNDILNKSKKLSSVYKCFMRNGLSKDCVYLLEESYITEFVHLVNTIEQNNELSEEVVTVAYQSLPIKNRKDLHINGNDLLEMCPSKKAGPWIAQLLLEIENEVIHERLSNTKEEIKEWASRWIRERN